MNNDAVMERFGYEICTNCNCDMPADEFVGGRCGVCDVAGKEES
jgi:hypothetical protein